MGDLADRRLHVLNWIDQEFHNHLTDDESCDAGEDRQEYGAVYSGSTCAERSQPPARVLKRLQGTMLARASEWAALLALILFGHVSFELFQKLGRE